MNTYLIIITSVLVLTQIIRITQNTISLQRQNKQIKRDIEWINERDITKEDFDVQRECFYLIRDCLKSNKKKPTNYERYKDLFLEVIAQNIGLEKGTGKPFSCSDYDHSCVDCAFSDDCYDDFDSGKQCENFIKKWLFEDE